MKNSPVCEAAFALALGRVVTCTVRPSDSSDTGAISDTSGAAIPGARVSVTNESTGIKSETVSNTSGNYSVLFLSPGNYRVDVQKDSSRSVRRTGISCKWRRP